MPTPIASKSSVGGIWGELTQQELSAWSLGQCLVQQASWRSDKGTTDKEARPCYVNMELVPKSSLGSFCGGGLRTSPIDWACHCGSSVFG